MGQLKECYSGAASGNRYRPGYVMKPPPNSSGLRRARAVSVLQQVRKIIRYLL